MRAFLEELKAAITGLGRAPGFAALAAGVLGLGLGAVIFMYGVADTLMLKPPPYPDADRLYTIVTIDGQQAGDFDGSMLPRDFEKVREAAGDKFEALGGIYVGTTYLTGDGQAERYDGAFADGHIFDVTGVAPELGRTILPRDTIEGAAPVVVLSHELWSERFDADPAIVGRTVRVNGKLSEVIGVMPKDYSFPGTAALWVANQEDPLRVSRQHSVDVQVFGRLKPGADPDEVQMALAPAAAAIKAEVGAQAFSGHFEMLPIAGGFIGDGIDLVTTLLIAVGFVLLIACANVSNLLLARSAYRVRETTVRSALGASRGRLVIHILAEGLVISALATFIGLLLASAALDAIGLAVSRYLEDSPNWWRFEVDSRVAIVTVGAALLSTLIAGLPAAIRASRPSLDSLLRDGGRMGTGLAIGRIAWGLVVVEVMLACLLLGLSALMTKSVLTATSSDVGVKTDDLMTARVGLTSGTYEERIDQVRFWEKLLARIQAQPGIEKAALTNSLPGHGIGDGPVTVEGRDYGDTATKPFVNYVTVSPSYFETMRIAPTQGRLFDSRDHYDGMSVTVISEFTAKSMFPDESPLGKRIQFDLDEDKTVYTIIGVVPDVLMDDDGVIDEGLYLSVFQHPQRFQSIVVRGQGDPRALIAPVRAALAQTDPDLALYWPRSFEESRKVKTAGLRIIGTIFAVFAGVAVLLAAAGLFGVLAFHVGQRTREIGVRRALGADDWRILKMVMRASGVQILLGLGVGMALLPLMGRGLGDTLGNVSPYDPGIYAWVVVLMVVVAVLATLTPTRRALKVHPAAALRYE
ncbi:MAG TPA: ADOP family duplicated permease [Steroidobacteraceae bacterium]|nr:ADOP family duplicated permease [Steroidobacteraceae bacterium]